MSTTAQRLEKLSAGFTRDITSLSKEALMGELEAEGLLLFRFKDLEEVAAHLGFLGTYHVREGSADPFYLIAPSENGSSERTVSQRGGKAFTTAALDPHSDYPALAWPPEVNVLLCQESASIGGASIFVDGKVIFQRLAQDYPAHLSILMQRGSVLNRYDNNVTEVPLFEWVTGSRLRIRARFDEFAFFNAPALEAVATVRSLLKEVALSCTLDSGEGYLMKNSQWLHGRESFTGSRTFQRLTINAHENLKHALGSFEPAAQSSNLPR
ncbi:MAG TPA: TauD/TfdA family dioxygenase [Allosphingosinicella sp.]|nr:TauD/TfdA family dioxygenase [Allosphingosinicella sp.]